MTSHANQPYHAAAGDIGPFPLTTDCLCATLGLLPCLCGALDAGTNATVAKEDGGSDEGVAAAETTNSFAPFDTDQFLQPADEEYDTAPDTPPGAERTSNNADFATDQMQQYGNEQDGIDSAPGNGDTQPEHLPPVEPGQAADETVGNKRKPSPIISARNKRSADKSRINNQNEIKYLCQKDVKLRVIYDKKAQGALDAEQADVEIKTIYGKYRQIAISMTEEDALPIANSRARIASGLAAKLWHAHRAAQSN